MPQRLIAVTVGEPAGIGPEIVAKALRDARVRRALRPLVLGPADVLRRWRLPGQTASSFALRALGRLRPGHPDARTGRASFEAVRLGARLALEGRVAALVTAPISKAAWDQAGVPFLDHTQFLRDFCGVKRAEMLLLAGPLRAVLATRHLPLARVPRRLSVQGLREIGALACAGLRRLGLSRPRLGVLALNPHAGEGGLLGREELRVLRPAVAGLRRRGIAASGPLPADDGWRRLVEGSLDVLVALYHDQALIPLKSLRPREIVNHTLGLPFIRTSPGHGTALDIAGRAQADPEALIQALLLAARLAGGRRS